MFAAISPQPMSSEAHLGVPENIQHVSVCEVEQLIHHTRLVLGDPLLAVSQSEYLKFKGYSVQRSKHNTHHGLQQFFYSRCICGDVTHRI